VHKTQQSYFSRGALVSVQQFQFVIYLCAKLIAGGQSRQQVGKYQQSSEWAQFFKYFTSSWFQWNQFACCGRCSAGM